MTTAGMTSPKECFKVPIKLINYVSQSDEIAYTEAIRECTVDFWSVEREGKSANGLVRISINHGLTDEEADETRNRIFEVLLQAQGRKEIERGHEYNFPVTLDLLIPEKLGGYVIGTNGQTIHKIREKAGNCTLFMDDGRINQDPVPKGFARLVIFDKRVSNVKAAREQVKELLERASLFNAAASRTDSSDDEAASHVGTYAARCQQSHVQSQIQSQRPGSQASSVATFGLIGATRNENRASATGANTVKVGENWTISAGGFGKSRKLAQNQVPVQVSSSTTAKASSTATRNQAVELPAYTPSLASSEETLCQDLPSQRDGHRKKKSQLASSNGSIASSNTAEEIMQSFLDLGHRQVDDTAKLMADKIADFTAELKLLREQNKKMKAKLQRKNAQVDEIINGNSSGSKRQCVSCNSAEPNVAFYPCGHLVLCADCAETTSTCPSCQQKGIRKIAIKY